MTFEGVDFYTTLPDPKTYLDFFLVIEHVTQVIFSSTIWGVGNFEKQYAQIHFLKRPQICWFFFRGKNGKLNKINLEWVFMLGKSLGHELYKSGPHLAPPWMGTYFENGSLF